MRDSPRLLSAKVVLPKRGITSTTQTATSSSLLLLPTYFIELELMNSLLFIWVSLAPRGVVLAKLMVWGLVLFVTMRLDSLA